MSASGVAPLLIIAWGNPSRGDDAVGPLLAERLRVHAAARLPPGHLDVLVDFQLQVEHALDLVGRARVLFIDAAVGLTAPYTVRPLQPARTRLDSHALPPEAVLHVCRDLLGHALPAATLLAIRATAFELGSPPSARALADLALAEAWARRWLHGAIAPAALTAG